MGRDEPGSSDIISVEHRQKTIYTNGSTVNSAGNIGWIDCCSIGCVGPVVFPCMLDQLNEHRGHTDQMLTASRSMP